MSTICGIFIYFFEQIISLMYFKSKFELKRKKYVLYSAAVASFLIQYFVSTAETEYNFVLNILSFFVCNLLLLYSCFWVKLSVALFNTVLLEGLMITTELVVMYFISAILKVNLDAYTDNVVILFVETAATKAFYFLVVMLVSRIKRKEAKNIKDYTLVLLVVPFLSALVIVLFGKIITEIALSSETYFMLSIITMILLISNIVVFEVHEKIVSILLQNTELQLERQKSEISEEYYQELEKQYERSNILVHDIKRQLNAINDLAKEENGVKINEYISSVNEGYQIGSIKRYTVNKLLNVIVTRYANMCLECGIIFDCDIRDVDLSFISDGDLTALVDNLLENAYEAAIKSSEKNISFSIDIKNENFILFVVSNSCDTAPKFSGGRLISDKSDETVHGYGIKSIKKVIRKYHGDIDFNYKETEKTFCVTVMFENK